MTAAADALTPRLRWFGWGPPGPSIPSYPPTPSRCCSAWARAPTRRPSRWRTCACPRPTRPTWTRCGRSSAPTHVRDDRLTRVSHAAGRSYLDLLALRAGDASGAPDAVIYPADAGEVAAVLAACAQARIDVVPFGGGTSVVGGVTPPAQRTRALISLDLARLDRPGVRRPRRAYRDRPGGHDRAGAGGRPWASTG